MSLKRKICVCGEVKVIKYTWETHDASHPNNYSVTFDTPPNRL